MLGCTKVLSLFPIQSLRTINVTYNRYSIQNRAGKFIIELNVQVIIAASYCSDMIEIQFETFSVISITINTLSSYLVHTN